MNKKLIDNHIFMELGIKLGSKILTKQEISVELLQNMEENFQNLENKVRWRLLDTLWWNLYALRDEKTN
jgi:hypothetical protein